MSNSRPGINFIAVAPVQIVTADNVGLNATDVTISTNASIPFLNACWSGVLPTLAGPGLELSIPKVNGAAMTFDLLVMFSRLSVLPIGSTTFRCEKSAGGSAFSASTIASLTHTTTDYEKKNEALTGTVTSGDVLRLYFVTMAGSGGTYNVLLEGRKH